MTTCDQYAHFLHPISRSAGTNPRHLLLAPTTTIPACLTFCLSSPPSLPPHSAPHSIPRSPSIIPSFLLTLPPLTVLPPSPSLSPSIPLIPVSPSVPYSLPPPLAHPPHQSHRSHGARGPQLAINEGAQATARDTHVQSHGRKKPITSAHATGGRRRCTDTRAKDEGQIAS